MAGKKGIGAGTASFSWLHVCTSPSPAHRHKCSYAILHCNISRSQEILQLGVYTWHRPSRRELRLWLSGLGLRTDWANLGDLFTNPPSFASVSDLVICSRTTSRKTRLCFVEFMYFSSSRQLVFIVGEILIACKSQQKPILGSAWNLLYETELCPSRWEQWRICVQCKWAVGYVV